MPVTKYGFSIPQLLKPIKQHRWWCTDQDPFVRDGVLMGNWWQGTELQILVDRLEASKGKVAVLLNRLGHFIFLGSTKRENGNSYVMIESIESASGAGRGRHWSTRSAKELLVILKHYFTSAFSNLSAQQLNKEYRDDDPPCDTQSNSNSKNGSSTTGTPNINGNGNLRTTAIVTRTHNTAIGLEDNHTSSSEHPAISDHQATTRVMRSHTGATRSQSTNNNSNTTRGTSRKKDEGSNKNNGTTLSDTSKGIEASSFDEEDYKVQYDEYLKLKPRHWDLPNGMKTRPRLPFLIETNRLHYDSDAKQIKGLLDKGDRLEVYRILRKFRLTVNDNTVGDRTVVNDDDDVENTEQKDQRQIENEDIVETISIKEKNLDDLIPLKPIKKEPVSGACADGNLEGTEENSKIAEE